MKVSNALKSELNRVVRNYNAKISRLEHSQDKSFLPKKVSTKELLNRVNSSAELRKELKSLQRFSRRGAEELYVNKAGLKMTKWERREIGIQVRATKKKLNRELQKLQRTNINIFGVDMRYTHAQMGTNTEKNLKAQIESISISKFENARFKSDIARLKDLTGKYNYRYGKKKKFIFRENYIEMIDKLGYELEESEKDELKNMIRKMSPTEFFDKFSSDEGMSEILLRYNARMDSSQLEFSATDTSLLEMLKDKLSK